MRKLTLLVAILLSVATIAKGKSGQEVVFYGVDFSSVNLVGATEQKENIIRAFKGINGLFISEPKKYNVEYYFGVDVESIDTDTAMEQIDKLNKIDFIDKKRSEVNVKKIISKYPKEDGLGLVIIAKELNKFGEYGSFIAVTFNSKTKQIISEDEISGTPSGFGIRNYWAGSLYRAMRSLK